MIEQKEREDKAPCRKICKKKEVKEKKWRDVERK